MVQTAPYQVCEADTAPGTGPRIVAPRWVKPVTFVRPGDRPEGNPLALAVGNGA